MPNNVNVSTTTNQVVITPQSNKIISIDSGDGASLTVNQGSSNTITVSDNIVNTSLTPNTVNITTPPSNGITVTDLRKTITVNQGITSTVQVASIGPQGPVGPQGPPGPSSGDIATGSLLTTASIIDATITFTKGNSSTFNIEVNNVTSSISASYVQLAQTASYVENAQSASYVENAQTASYVENAQTASYVENAQSASYVQLAQSASYVQLAQSASYVQLAQSASYVQLAQSASYVAAADIDGTIDISDQTNLAGGTNLTLSDDTMNLDANISLTSITASGNISASGDIIANNATITTQLTAAGINYPTTVGDNGDTIFTDGAGNLSFGRTTIYANVKNVHGSTLVKGMPVHATGTAGNASEVVAASASNAATMPATYVLAQELDDQEEGLAIVTGYINGVDTSLFGEGDVIYVGADGGYTNSKPTGSNLIQNLGIVAKSAENGSGYVYGSGRSNDVPNITPGYAWVGNSDSVATAVATSSFVVDNATSASYVSSSGNIIADSITLSTSSVQDTYMIGFSRTTDGIANRSSYFLSFDNNSTALKNSNFGATNFPISASDYYNRVIPCDDMTIADGKSIDITGMLIVSGASNINYRQVQIDLYTASITPNNTTNPSDPLNFTRAFQGNNIALDVAPPFNSIHHFTQSFDISTLPTNSLIAVALSNDSPTTAVTTNTNVSISLRLTRNYKKKN